MSDRDRDDEDLAERLDELEATLDRLQSELKSEAFRPPHRPPRLSELVRFTEQYTIPTLIALLETTIQSLELLRGILRLADPGRSLTPESGTTGDRLSGVREEAERGVARSLSELRTALSESDLPEEAASRSIIDDARELSAEIERRLEEGSRPRREGSTGESPEAADSDDGPVSIDVVDPDAEDGDGDEDEEGHRDVDEENRPAVDVESELESIKDQLDDVSRGAEEGRDGGEADESGGEEDDNGAAADGTEGDDADSDDTHSDDADRDDADRDDADRDDADRDDPHSDHADRDGDSEGRTPDRD